MELEMDPDLKQALVGIAMFLMMLRVLLCPHQDAYEAYCCCGIGLK